MPTFSNLSILGLSILAVCVAYSQTDPMNRFEVASLKPAVGLTGGGVSVRASGRPVARPRIGCSGGPNTNDPGQWVCNSTALSTLIMTAFKLPRYQFTPPGWMDEARFDIVAKIPPGTTPEQFRLMQQDLLATRFQLAVHFEEKEMPGYDLAVGKDGPKFKESVDDAPDYTPPPAPRTMDWDKTDGFPVLPPGNQTVLWFLNGRVSNRWRKVTMEELAKYLADQLVKPVSDATKLAGKYDLTLKFVAVPMPLPGTPIELDANGERIPPVINSRPTLFEAVKTQLGLALEP